MKLRRVLKWGVVGICGAIALAALRYPLSEAPEAIRYLETGRARGKVVITLE